MGWAALGENQRAVSEALEDLSGILKQPVEMIIPNNPNSVDQSSLTIARLEFSNDREFMGKEIISNAVKTLAASALLSFSALKGFTYFSFSPKSRLISLPFSVVGGFFLFYQLNFQSMAKFLETQNSTLANRGRRIVAARCPTHPLLLRYSQQKPREIE